MVNEKKGITETIVDVSPDPIVIVDKKAKVEYANKVALKLVGKKAEELIGRSVFRAGFISSKSKKQIAKSMKGSLIKKKKVNKYDIEVVDKNQKKRIFELKSKAIFNDKKIEKWIVVLRDKTKEKEESEMLKKEKERAQLYLKNAGTILLVLDGKGKVKMLNDLGYEILGYDKGFLKGKDWFSYCVPKEERKKLKKVHNENLKKNVSFNGVMIKRILTKEGKEKVIRWKNQVLKKSSGEAIGVLSSGEDITEKKENEDKLKKNIEELDRFSKFAINREKRMIELKKEVNSLLKELNKKQKYKIVHGN